MAAQARSPVASTCSVPATPTNMTSAEMGTLTHPVASGSVPQVEKEDGQADWNSSNFDGRQSVQSLASAFDFTCLPGPQTVTASTTASPPSITPRVRSACRGCGHVYPRCACSAPLTRNSTSMGTLPVPVRIATPAPGWLNPEVDPNELPIGTSGRLQQVTSASGDWSFLANGSNAWSFTTTTATGSRYEPYRSPSIASTASNSTQGIFSPSPAQSGQRLSVHEGAGGRRRSSTVGSLPGLSSGLVDRVRLMANTRPQSPMAQQQPLPSSPRSASRINFNSMPCRGSRPSEPALRSVFL